ncbi:hypothetical protein DSO57_1019703 [Entomophthora muscae]|uniref:Uncharacterized protein n=1 Tax=Entomophthora muscae TaxID=34485 RepID=A0ACC2TR87_9FUNG|nr:hypothetical protein DSO57_1019703 [Entomophthora muscae]
MGLNTYFPQLSPVSSLWSSFRAAVPVIHWAASWWFVSPGWEPKLVSLAPSLTISINLWTQISSFACLAGNNPTSLLHLLDELPGKTTGLLFSEEILVKSLTCNNLDYYLPNLDLVPHSTKKTPENIQPLLERSNLLL